MVNPGGRFGGMFPGRTSSPTRLRRARTMMDQSGYTAPDAQGAGPQTGSVLRGIGQGLKSAGGAGPSTSINGSQNPIQHPNVIKPGQSMTNGQGLSGNLAATGSVLRGHAGGVLNQGAANAPPMQQPQGGHIDPRHMNVGNRPGINAGGSPVPGGSQGGVGGMTYGQQGAPMQPIAHTSGDVASPYHYTGEGIAQSLKYPDNTNGYGNAAMPKPPGAGGLPPSFAPPQTNTAIPGGIMSKGYNMMMPGQATPDPSAAQGTIAPPSPYVQGNGYGSSASPGLVPNQHLTGGYGGVSGAANGYYKPGQGVTTPLQSPGAGYGSTASGLDATGDPATNPSPPPQSDAQKRQAERIKAQKDWNAAHPDHQIQQETDVGKPNYTQGGADDPYLHPEADKTGQAGAYNRGKQAADASGYPPGSKEYGDAYKAAYDKSMSEWQAAHPKDNGTGGLYGDGTTSGGTSANDPEFQKLLAEMGNVPQLDQSALDASIRAEDMNQAQQTSQAYQAMAEGGARAGVDAGQAMGQQGEMTHQAAIERATRGANMRMQAQVQNFQAQVQAYQQRAQMALQAAQLTQNADEASKARAFAAQMLQNQTEAQKQLDKYEWELSKKMSGTDWLGLAYGYHMQSKADISNIIGSAMGGKGGCDKLTKKRIRPAGAEVLDALTTIDPVSFEYDRQLVNEDEGRFWGVLAQDLISSEAGRTMVYKDGSNGYLRIDPKRAIPFLLAAVAALARALESK